MHPTIEEIIRWRVGEPVRPDVQRRWQHDLARIDEDVAQLRALVAEMSAVKSNGEAAKKAGGR
jgi:hypothetical protein